MAAQDNLVRLVHKVLKAKMEFLVRRESLERQDPLVCPDFRVFEVNLEHRVILVSLALKEHPYA